MFSSDHRLAMLRITAKASSEVRQPCSPFLGLRTRNCDDDRLASGLLWLRHGKYLLLGNSSKVPEESIKCPDSQTINAKLSPTSIIPNPQVTCSSSPQSVTCRIDEPNVTRRISTYPQITFSAGIA
jgi:hypothetical protein